jgi:FlaA1/EpsC-like NDP-sugar epimerase
MHGFFKYFHPRRLALCFSIEFLLISGAFLLAAVMRLSGGMPRLRSGLPYLPHACLAALVCQTCMYYATLYDLRVARTNRTLFIGLLKSLGAALAVLGVCFYVLPQLFVGRGVLLLGLAIAFCCIVGWRLLYQHLYTLNQFHINVLILGTGEEAKKLVGEIVDKQHLGYDIRGFIGDSDEVGRNVL